MHGGCATGALTLEGVGICTVTATAAGTADYNEATDTDTVTVQAAGTLALNVGTISGDDTINIAEKAEGFAIGGNTGSEAGVSVTVQVGTATLSATSADDNGTATWSVSVPADAVYITGASVAVRVSAAKTGFTAPADVERALAIDLTAPVAPTYTAPGSLKVGVAITAMSPTGASGVNEYSAPGLPTGLSIDAGTGVISGTPTAADTGTATATVTVSDTADNTAMVDITFPAVAKGDQTLSGFSYSPSSVTLGSAAPTLTVPGGAQGALSYAASPSTVCTVDAATGALTLEGVGICTVTVTAADTDDYNEASATYTVTNITPGNATGKPVIMKGTLVYTTECRAPERGLFAKFDDIADTNGLYTAPAQGSHSPTGLWCKEPMASCAFQWIRIDGSDEVDIVGATRSFYEPQSADLGKKVKMRVSFNDKTGNRETLTSDAFPGGSSTITETRGHPPVSLSPACNPPRIEGAPRVSGTGGEGVWSTGETVEVAFTFSERVSVDTSDGTPSVGIGLGGDTAGTAARNAAYVSGGGTAELAFAYAMVEGDGLHNIMAVTPNSLALNGGRIFSLRNPHAAALLEHDGASSQQVEVDPPTVDGTPIVSGAGGDGIWTAGETVRVALTFSEAVDVDTSGGTPSVGIGLGGDTAETAARSATYQSGSGTAELIFAYTLAGEDGSHSLMAVTPDSLALRGGTIRSVATRVGAELGNAGALVQGRNPRSAGPDVMFRDVPEHHDGASPFTVGLQFSGVPAGLKPKRDAASVLEVTGGSVTAARQTAGGPNPAWEVTVTPDGMDGVTVRIPVRACTEAQAVCIGGQPLAEAAEAVVPGPAITASFTQTPATHDGSGEFLLHLEFSHEPQGFSDRTVQGGLFDVAGGRITEARRLVPGRNLRWEMTVVPDGGGAVTLDSRATTDCTAQHAACDAEGRKFAGNLSLTIPGPETPSVVSIAAPAETPVTEGATLAFTLARTGDTAAALTVAVHVTETGNVLDGEPPASATFEADSASATLSVATLDDEAVEAAATVTAAVSPGAGYEVDGASASAEVVVEDDDAAPVVGTASLIEVPENAMAVAVLSATDEDTAVEDLAWSIPEGTAGGADAAQFALTEDGVLSFGAAKDFAAPDDANADGEYKVTVRVTDGANPVDAGIVVRLADADDAAPALSSASVDGTTLTLIFGEALHAGSAPASSSFAVTVGGSARTVEAATISGSTVTLTLSSAVSSVETVTVGYTAPTEPEAAALRDAAGNRVASFADAQVTNAAAAALPVVSIAPASTPVTEGTAATFALARTGDTAAALTVAVSVGQAGSVLDGTPPSSATFAAGASEARLSVATTNDGAHEADARVRASVVAGEGYAVDGENASAGVDVFDDDAAPPVAVVVVELWSTTLVWADIGNGWYGGFADAFSNPVWSEDGEAYRIWYISYDAGSRALLMAHDGSGGVIAEPGQLALHVGELEVGPGEALSTFAGAGVGRVAGVDAQWNVGEEVRVRLTRTVEDAVQAPAGPGFSVADAQVNEASGAPLRFRVTLDAPAESTVSVRYRTANGTARAGEDYVAAHGALRFARGETAKTVEVAVVQDSHDEGSETMTLTLSGPDGATIADATATGTISNTGPIPKAWVARFGRTVTEQAIDGVEARFAAPREAGFAGTLAGQPLGGFVDPAPVDARVEDTRAGPETIAEWSHGRAEEDDEDGLGARTLSGRELLSTSTFNLTQGTAESGFASFWGRGVVTRFDGRDGEMTLDGEVASAMVGADWSRDALLGGLMVSHSSGEGSYRDSSGSGTVESTLTALFPYAHYTLTERVSMWGMAGYGEGTLTLTPEGHAPLRPELDFLMGALGMRGVLVDGGAGGATLAAKSDAFAVRTSTGAVSGSAGNLEASRADVTRVRFALEGSRPVQLGESAVLTPSLELGVRHDGGDAETGFGADMGAGLALSDPARGLSAELRAGGLLTHEADGMRERGVSGALSFDPAPETERGLSVSLTQTVGARGEGGAEALLERQSLAGLGAQDDNELSARRLDARIGYGFGVLDDRFTAVSELGLGLSDTNREVRLGWRLTERVSAGVAFEFGVEGTRREWTDGEAGPQHGIVIGVGWRLAGASASHSAFDMRIEAARLDTANDDSPPENTIGLTFRARW